MNAYRKLRYNVARSSLRAPLTWMQHRGLNRNDMFLAAFERSGSTWLRFVLSEILSGQPAQFTNVNTIIPELFLHRQGKPVVGGQARLIKTHEPYRGEYHRAIYLVRDVRDVLLSNYVREKAMGMTEFVSDGSLDQYMHHFLAGKTVRYGSWQNHVESWLNSPLAACGDLLVVRYEDLRANTEEHLKTILEFLGVTASAKRVREAIENNSLEKMRQKEDKVKADREKSEKDVLLKFHRNGGSEDARFVRSGSVAGWRGRLTDYQLEEIDRLAGSTLIRCGYPLASTASGSDQELGAELPAR